MAIPLADMQNIDSISVLQPAPRQKRLEHYRQVLAQAEATLHDIQLFRANRLSFSLSNGECNNVPACEKQSSSETSSIASDCLACTPFAPCPQHEQHFSQHQQPPPAFHCRHAQQQETRALQEDNALLWHHLSFMENKLEQEQLKVDSLRKTVIRILRADALGAGKPSHETQTTPQDSREEDADLFLTPLVRTRSVQESQAHRTPPSTERKALAPKSPAPGSSSTRRSCLCGVGHISSSSYASPPKKKTVSFSKR